MHLRRRREGRAVKKMETFEQGSLEAENMSLTHWMSVSDRLLFVLTLWLIIERCVCVCVCVCMCACNLVLITSLNVLRCDVQKEKVPLKHLLRCNSVITFTASKCLLDCTSAFWWVSVRYVIQLPVHNILSFTVTLHFLLLASGLYITVQHSYLMPCHYFHLLRFKLLLQGKLYNVKSILNLTAAPALKDASNKDKGMWE